mmetsp:Transcript_17608/g.45035  ORF Transcript_17608/g.45035 Transcript_17608/m.45035 type:complete len:234 (+) Transcript_17608:574-1275(+)
MTATRRPLVEMTLGVRRPPPTARMPPSSTRLATVRAAQAVGMRQMTRKTRPVTTVATTPPARARATPRPATTLTRRAKPPVTTPTTTPPTPSPRQPVKTRTVTATAVEASRATTTRTGRRPPGTTTPRSRGVVTAVKTITTRTPPQCPPASSCHPGRPQRAPRRTCPTGRSSPPTRRRQPPLAPRRAQPQQQPQSAPPPQSASAQQKARLTGRARTPPPNPKSSPTASVCPPA